MQTRLPAQEPAPARLLERDGELAALASLVDRAAAGTAGVAIVEGPAGIGKCRLAAEARARAEAKGFRVLAARGGQLEREFAFGVVRQLFEPVVADADGRDRHLTGGAAAAAPVFDPLAPEAGAIAGDPSFAVLHGLFWLTVNLTGDRPLLLAVDDLHWCDRASLRFLAYLARRVEGLPLLLLCCLRPAEPGIDRAPLAEIATDPVAVPVQPGPLSPAAVAELVRERLGAGAGPAFVATCHDATGGNPLLLTELLAALAAEAVQPTDDQVETVAEIGPRAVWRSVLLRLGRLDADARSLARATAILGDDADLGTAAALAGLDPAVAAAAATSLARWELLRPEPPLGFVHPLVRDAVYESIVVGDRQLGHERAALLLRDLAAPAERIAAHLLAVPPRGEPWVVETLLDAAHGASQRGAAESAATYLERALAEPPADQLRPRLLLELGLAEALTHGPAGVEHLRAAYETLVEPHLHGVAALALARTLLQTGDPEGAAAVAHEGAASLPAGLVDARRALETFALGTAFFGMGALDDVAPLEAHRTGPVDDGVGAKLLAALSSFDWAYTGDGRSEDCAALALRALEGGDVIAADNGFLSVGPIAALTLADRDEAMDAWEASIDDAHRRGSLYAISSVHLWRGFTLLRRGELADAQEDLDAAWREFEEWGFGGLAARYCAGFRGATLVERGRLDEARAALDATTHPGVVADGTRWWLLGRLELAVAAGADEEALELAAELERDYGRVRNPAACPWRGLAAQALARLDRRDEALELAREEVALARSWGAPWGLGRALRTLGTIEPDGRPRLRDAVAVLEGSAARLELAKALAALGASLRRDRRPVESREPLRRALELATACSADGLAETVRAELYAGGARPRAAALSGVGSLTASERRVAALAAEGRTNREIAQALFVTPKTVEVHLSNVYRKLGIRSRRALPAALA